jgi:hypothetical protein
VTHEEQPLPRYCPGVEGAHDLMIRDLGNTSSYIPGVLYQATVERIVARKKVGFDRYGQLLCPDDGRDTLRDAMEEALDLCAYLRNLLRLGHKLETTYYAAFGVLLDLVCEQDGIPKPLYWTGFAQLAVEASPG